MTTSDMAMARVDRLGWTNLTLGEPRFLQEALKTFYPSVAVAHDDHRRYQDCRGDDMLIFAVSEVNHKNVVITTGAKQGLAAAAHALSRLYKHGAVSAVTAEAPYWPGMPTVARSVGLEWSYISAPYAIQIQAWPNNPNGCEKLPSVATGPVIWDAAYASPLYGWDGSEPVGWIAKVSSAAKLYGLSGHRVGWVEFQGPDAERLVELAAEYVESMTSGVSTLSQEYLDAFLSKKSEDPETHAFLEDRAGTFLASNCELFMDNLESHMDVVQGAPAGRGGMFAWFKPRDPEKFRAALQKAQVLVLGGHYCGELDLNWFRMSMGLCFDEFEEAIGRLRAALR